ncbi:MAG: DUF2279 domain-containing protein [Bacteroidia bacterium]|nr:DUF2279 domain-containing protein [Bacteroidia bacterium]
MIYKLRFTILDLTNFEFRISICVSLFLCFQLQIFAQDKEVNFFQSAEEYNSKRLQLVGITTAASFTGSLIGLNKYWYSNYTRTSFHFFNDNKEWNQVDKLGHIVTAYYVGKFGIDVLNWCGVEENKSMIYGGLLGSLVLTNIEILDGFSEKWGASYGDLTANSLGSALVMVQHYKWKEQRVLLKFSSHKVNYNESVENRAKSLYGDKFMERTLKDYNGQTYWLSANIKSFILKDSKLPDWLNISAGYGAEGMLGGFGNEWAENEEVIIRDDIKRYRQYYLSFDIDLTRIETKSLFLNTFLSTFGFIKIPAPTIEFNGINQLKFHPFYF